MKEWRRWGGNPEMMFSCAVGVVAALLMVLTAHPCFFGLWEDDVIYFCLGHSLALGRGAAVEVMPDMMVSHKYPMLYPFLLSLVFRVAERGESVLVWAMAMQAVIFAANVLLLCQGLARRWGLTLAERVALAVLVMFHLPSLAFYPALMTEGLYLLLLQLSLLLLPVTAKTEQQGGGWRNGTLAILTFLAAMTRSAHWVVGPGLLAAALWRRKWGTAAAVAGGLLAAVVVGQSLKEAPERQEELRRTLPYYSGYGASVEPYREAFQNHGFGAMTRTLAAFAWRNLQTGTLTLAETVLPVNAGNLDPGVSSSGITQALMVLVAAFFMVFLVLGFIRAPDTRWIWPLTACYAGFFLFWTWPFVIRFWVQIYPVLLPVFILGLRCLRSTGKPVLGCLCGAVLLTQIPLIWERHLSIGAAGEELGAPPASTALSDLEKQAQDVEEADAWLKRNVSGNRGDLIVGGQLTLKKALFLQASGLHLPTLYKASDHLRRVTGVKDVVTGQDVNEPGLWLENLSTVQRHLRPGARIFIVADFSVGRRERKMLEELARAGAVHATHRTPHGFVTIYSPGPADGVLFE